MSTAIAYDTSLGFTKQMRCYICIKSIALSASELDFLSLIRELFDQVSNSHVFHSKISLFKAFSIA